MSHAKRIRKARMRRRQQRRRSRAAWREAPGAARNVVLYTMTALVQRDLDRLLAGEHLRTSDLLASFRDGFAAAHWRARSRETEAVAKRSNEGDER